MVKDQKELINNNFETKFLITKFTVQSIRLQESTQTFESRDRHQSDFVVLRDKNIPVLYNLM